MVLIPTLAFLLFLGTPFLRLTQGVPDASVLPPGIESREASVALSNEFRKGETTPIVILATVTGSPTDAANVQKILDYAKAVDAVDGVDRVEGPSAQVRCTSEPGGGFRSAAHGWLWRATPVDLRTTVAQIASHQVGQPRLMPTCEITPAAAGEPKGCPRRWRPNVAPPRELRRVDSLRPPWGEPS